MYCLNQVRFLGPVMLPAGMVSFGSSTGSVKKANAVGELSVRDVPTHSANEPFEVRVASGLGVLSLIDHISRGTGLPLIK